MSGAHAAERTLDGRSCLVLSGPEEVLRATFLPGLGMVCCSLLHRGEELLAQLGGADAYERRGSTFAIPLLHPYANRLSGWSYALDGHEVTIDPGSSQIHLDPVSGLPIHGLMAGRHWTVEDARADGDEARLTAGFDFGAHPELLELFPFPHRLSLSASLTDARLSLSVTVTATSVGRVPVSFGFHPYLTLPGSPRESWQLELPVRRRALLDARLLPTGESEELEPGALSGPFAERTFDDCFDALEPPPAVFAVSDSRRRVALEFGERYPIAQVYAAEGSQFVCFEPMTAPIAALSSGAGLQWAEPGSSFTAEFSVVVSDSH
jgi:aldose 1-epimerase